MILIEFQKNTVLDKNILSIITLPNDQMLSNTNKIFVKGFKIEKTWGFWNKIEPFQHPWFKVMIENLNP